MSKGLCADCCGHEQSALSRAREAGLRITKGMQAVVTLLHGNRSQLSATEIHALLQAKGGGQGLPTVYRICDNLVDAGVLARQFATDGTMQYCLCMHPGVGHHHHFVCRACKQVYEIEECPVEEWAHSLRKNYGLVLETHLLELQGLCTACYQSSLKISP